MKITRRIRWFGTNAEMTSAVMRTQGQLITANIFVAGGRGKRHFPTDCWSIEIVVEFQHPSPSDMEAIDPLTGKLFRWPKLMPIDPGSIPPRLLKRLTDNKKWERAALWGARPDYRGIAGSL